MTKQDLDHFDGALRKILHRSVDTADQIEGESLDVGGGGLDTQGDAGADAEFEEVDLDSLGVEEAATEAAAAALKRISDGTFGRCTTCNEWIPRGRLDDAHRRAEEALAVRRQLPYELDQGHSLLVLAAVLAEQGRPDDAAGHLDEALEIGHKLDSEDLQLRAHITGALHLGRDASDAVAAQAAGASKLASAGEVELHHELWRLTGDDSFLQAAREALDYLLAHAPTEYRDTMVDNVPLYRRVQSGS